MNLRLAVLLTNNDTSPFAAHFPNDGQKVVQLLQPLRPDWTFEVVPVKDGVLPASPADFDGYVITGSPASVNDDSLPWVGQLLDFICAVNAARQPLVGLCFGHQAVARALGGQVVRNAAGWGLGTAPTHWQTTRPWMQPAQSTTTLMAAHNEQVTRMPEGAVCLGGSDFCPIGSMQIGQHIWTTQFHPRCRWCSCRPCWASWPTSSMPKRWLAHTPVWPTPPMCRCLGIGWRNFLNTQGKTSNDRLAPQRRWPR